MSWTGPSGSSSGWARRSTDTSSSSPTATRRRRPTCCTGSSPANRFIRPRSGRGGTRAAATPGIIRSFTSSSPVAHSLPERATKFRVEVKPPMSDVLAQVRTMQAAILVTQKQPLEVDEVKLPERLAFGQVLVRVAYSGICGAQLNEIDGAKGEDK